MGKVIKMQVHKAAQIQLIPINVGMLPNLAEALEVKTRLTPLLIE
jgi:hypothetical protein